VVVLTFDDGVLFVAENAQARLHKVSEIYDKIGFAAVGGTTSSKTCAPPGTPGRPARVLV